MHTNSPQSTQQLLHSTVSQSTVKQTTVSDTTIRPPIHQLWFMLFNCARNKVSVLLCKKRMVVSVWSGCRCPGTESVTALICCGRNRTEPDTGYLHFLACSSVTYKSRNAAHIHLPFDNVMYNISARH